MSEYCNAIYDELCDCSLQEDHESDHECECGFTWEEE